MKKYGFLICLLLLIVILRGFTLDIYVNDRLWHSYSPQDLTDLRIDLTLQTGDTPGIPFAELIPLMAEIDSLRIGIPRGEMILKGEADSLRGSYLMESEEKGWDLSLDSSVYHAPDRIYIYGSLHESKVIRIWAEPGLPELKKQLDVWAGLHKTNVLVKEIPNLKDELIHSRMTGDLMPDFILVYLSPDQAFRTNETILYTLQSLLAPLKRNKIETLVTPAGFKAHPNLYLSILASLHPGESPLVSEIADDISSHRKAAAIYADLIIKRRILELNEFHTSQAFRDGNYAFFPSTAFPLQTGELLSLSEIQEMENPLRSRVFPLILETTGEGFTPGTLLDFLKLPGIQGRFLSPASRQLPSETDVLMHRNLTASEMSLLNDWKRGFILSQKNYNLTEAVYRRLPDLLRNEGGLP